MKLVIRIKGKIYKFFAYQFNPNFCFNRLCIVSLITLKRVTLCKLEKEWTRQVNSKGTTGNRYVNVLNTLIGVFSYHILLFNVVVVRFQKKFQFAYLRLLRNPHGLWRGNTFVHRTFWHELKTLAAGTKKAKTFCFIFTLH